MKNFRCYKCGDQVIANYGNYEYDDNTIGKFIVENINYSECQKCKEIYFTSYDLVKFYAVRDNILESINLMEYRQYIGTIKYSKEDEVYHGCIIDIQDLITYEGETKRQLFENFKEVVKNYIKYLEDKKNNI